MADANILIVDDEEAIREMISVSLELAGFQWMEAENGQLAHSMIVDERPDLILLDWMLPKGSGIEVCRTVRGVDPTIRALILTSYDDDEALFAAIMAGASGYVLKDVKGLDLVAAIRQVAEGNSLIDPALTARVLERVRNGPATAPELADLTEQELKLLALIAEGLTNRQIGERMFLAEKTVKNYVSSILAKLGLEGVPVIGLAKEFEEIYRPGESAPLRLGLDSGALKLLQRVRDESHRFANAYNAELRLKKISESILDELPGIGDSRKAALLKKFGSVQRLRKASLEDIQQVPGFGKKSAEALKDFLGTRTKSGKSV